MSDRERQRCLELGRLIVAAIRDPFNECGRERIDGMIRVMPARPDEADERIGRLIVNTCRELIDESRKAEKAAWPF